MLYCSRALALVPSGITEEGGGPSHFLSFIFFDLGLASFVAAATSKIQEINAFPRPLQTDAQQGWCLRATLRPPRLLPLTEGHLLQGAPWGEGLPTDPALH
jgi:hypothetical protein